VNLEMHTHWACGYVNVAAIRMIGANGKPTKAGEKANELLARIEDYPLLDEDAYSALVMQKIDEIDDYNLRQIADGLKIETKATTAKGLVKVIRAHRKGNEALCRWVES